MNLNKDHDEAFFFHGVIAIPMAASRLVTELG